RLDPLERLDHGVLPDAPGDRRAVHVRVVLPADGDADQLVRGGAARVAQADGGGEVGGVAGEPGRHVVVGGAGLAGRVAPDAADAAHRALGEDPGQDAVDGVGALLVEDLVALRLVRLDLACAVLDLGGRVRLATLAAGCIDGV